LKVNIKCLRIQSYLLSNTINYFLTNILICGENKYIFNS